MAKITNHETRVWYWEYELRVWDDIDDKEEIRSGVVTAETITEAVRDIEEYYGNNIMEILTFKPIVDGTIFDFQDAVEDGFSYEVSKSRSQS